MSTRIGPRINRLAAARLCSGIGGIALVTAIVGFLLQRDITLLVLISMVIGIVGIGLWITLVPGDLRALVSGRRALYGSNSIFSSILVIGIVAIVYTLTINSGVFADLTSVGYYSLKPQTRTVIQALPRPLQITAFYNNTRLSDQALDTPVLRMFADSAPDKIRLVFVDPDEQPLIAKQFGLVGSFGIYVSWLDANRQPDMKGTTQMRGTAAQEQWITEAILQLEAQGRYHVLFTVGHNEVGTDIEKKEDAYGIRNGLENVGINTGTIDLKSTEIPADTTALVIVGPERDFEQSEVDKIAKYMANGGKLLILANPAYRGAIQFMISPDSPMYKYLSAVWDIRPQNDIVFDPASYVDNPYSVMPASVAPHKLTNKDDTGATQVRPLLTITQSWDVPAADKVPKGLSMMPLFLSSPSSVGKTNVRAVAANPDNPDNLKQSPGDLSGPLVLAVAAQNETTKARLLVMGNSDWVLNDMVTTFDGYVLWTNIMDWLTQYLSNIMVTPTVTQLPLITDSATLNVVLLITLIVLPGLVLLAGGLVWWNRAHRQ